MADNEYRLVTYAIDGHNKAGILVDGHVHDAASVLKDLPGVDASSVRGILDAWDDGIHNKIKQAAASLNTSGGTALGNVELLAPLLYPGAIFCCGANYWDHFDEMSDYMASQGHPRPDRIKADDPFFFLKTTEHSVVGPDAKVKHPAHTKMLDWEAELAVVIGKRAANVSIENAFSIIAGCTILNDLSARDYILRPNSAFRFDWTPHKCFDGSAPMGPWITPFEFVGNPQELNVKTWVNGEIKQDSNANLMIHSIAEQIEYLTRHITLKPGDVIATGTPAGVGYPQETFLASGDEVRIEIENCGELINYIV